MRIRPQASFAMLSIGFALLSSGCPATYITVSSDAGASGGAAGENAAGAAGMSVGGAGGGYATGGTTGGGSSQCEIWHPDGTVEYYDCGYGGAAGSYAGTGGVGGGYAGTGGYAGEPCNVGGTGGYGCDPGYDTGCGVAGTGIGGAGGSAGIGIGGAGGDPCFDELGDDPLRVCACYYGTDNSDYYRCLNGYDAQNGGVGGAPASLCEHLAPWSVDHERCVNYYLNGGAGSYEEQGGTGGATAGAGGAAGGSPI